MAEPCGLRVRLVKFRDGSVVVRWRGVRCGQWSAHAPGGRLLAPPWNHCEDAVETLRRSGYGPAATPARGKLD